MPRPLFVILVAVLAWSGLGRNASARSKTDIVVLSNGDRITCEITHLDRGKLRIKTDDMGTVNIKWHRITALSSKFYFRVETRIGRRYFGALEMVEGESTLKVLGVQTAVSISADNVVEITPIEQDFWSRIDGSLDIGYNYTKTSGVQQFTFGWNNRYRTKKRLIQLNLQASLTDKGDSTGTAVREDYHIRYDHILRKRYSGSAGVNFQRNDELDLASRYLFSVGGTLNLRKSNHDYLFFSIGVALNLETTRGADASTQSAEGLLSAGYSIFVYDSPKIQISADAKGYPSITESGRFRLNVDLVASYELLKDFFLELSYYSQYDNQATAEGKPNRDYSINLGVGWTY